MERGGGPELGPRLVLRSGARHPREAPTPGIREAEIAARPEPAGFQQQGGEGLLLSNINFQYIMTESAESHVSS